MAGVIYHTAFNAVDYDNKVKFFEEVFNMTIWKTMGEVPNRKIWFNEGIQINETTDVSRVTYPDHLGVHVDSIENTVETAKKFNAELLQGKTSWIKLPDGLVFELVEKQNS